MIAILRYSISVIHEGMTGTRGKISIVFFAVPFFGDVTYVVLSKLLDFSFSRTKFILYLTKILSECYLITWLCLYSWIDK